MRGAKLVGLYRIQIRGLPAAFSLVVDRTILERPSLVSKEGEATNWGCQDDTCAKKKGTEKSRPPHMHKEQRDRKEQAAAIGGSRQRPRPVFHEIYRFHKNGKLDFRSS